MEYENNMYQQRMMHCLMKTPAARRYLDDALDQPFDKFLFWIESSGFDSTYSDEESKAVLFIRLVLTDYYANCIKSVAMAVSN